MNKAMEGDGQKLRISSLKDHPRPHHITNPPLSDATSPGHSLHVVVSTVSDTHIPTSTNPRFKVLTYAAQT